MDIKQRLQVKIFHREQRCDVGTSDCMSYPVAFLVSESGGTKQKVCVNCLASLMNHIGKTSDQGGVMKDEE
ncbi:hypothetical protein [Brevibacillus sp. 179-C9.3 HS]|uniref:hypothetical protein n=1 Tax=unclassified Brevibacillus TaxID=2684853 RepID=UPI0039A1B3B4